MQTVGNNTQITTQSSQNLPQGSISSLVGTLPRVALAKGVDPMTEAAAIFSRANECLGDPNNILDFIMCRLSPDSYMLKALTLIILAYKNSQYENFMKFACDIDAFNQSYWELYNRGVRELIEQIQPIDAEKIDSALGQRTLLSLARKYLNKCDFVEAAHIFSLIRTEDPELYNELSMSLFFCKRMADVTQAPGYKDIELLTLREDMKRPEGCNYVSHIFASMLIFMMLPEQMEAIEVSKLNSLPFAFELNIPEMSPKYLEAMLEGFEKAANGSPSEHMHPYLRSLADEYCARIHLIKGEYTKAIKHAEAVARINPDRSAQAQGFIDKVKHKQSQAGPEDSIGVQFSKKINSSLDGGHFDGAYKFCIAFMTIVKGGSPFSIGLTYAYSKRLALDRKLDKDNELRGAIQLLCICKPDMKSYESDLARALHSLILKCEQDVSVDFDSINSIPFAFEFVEGKLAEADIKDLLATFEKAMTQQPDEHIHPYFKSLAAEYAAKLHFGLGEMDNASRCLTEVLKINPERASQAKVLREAIAQKLS